MEVKNNLFSGEGVTHSNRFLHTPSIFARKNLLYVQEVGRLKSIQPHICRRENLNSFLIFTVLEGQGSLTIQNQKYELRAGDCVFLNCMDAYEHISSKENAWELMWVHFYGENAEEYYELFVSRNNTQNIFRPQENAEVLDCICGIMDLKDEKDLDAELKAALYLTKLLTLCVCNVSGEVKLEEVRDFINSNYCEENLIKLLTERYHKTETEINNAFFKNYGIELRDYILVKRFTAAKELLRFTIKDIDDIVNESGIRNVDLFRQLFRENEGMSAEEYRMKWAQWIKA